MAEREYQSLAKMRLRPFLSQNSVWIGRDHLLSVDSPGFQERYRRFYFRDIQSIAIRGTNRRSTLNWILSGALLLFLLLTISAFSSTSRFLEVITIIADVSIAIPLLVNNILGTACDVYIRTAVQESRLPALGRIRRARKILDRIRPFIASAQEPIAPMEMIARVNALQSNRTPAPPSAPPPSVEAAAAQQMDQIES